MSVFRPAIIGLLGCRRPAKVAGFVMALIINSVNCESFGPRANVPEDPISECGIVIDPGLMHGNSACAIPNVARTLDTETPRFNVAPQLIERLITPAMCRVALFGGAIFIQAAATLRTATQEICCAHDNLTPAITLTDALAAASFSLSRQPEHGEPSEFFPSEVNWPWPFQGIYPRLIGSALFPRHVSPLAFCLHGQVANPVRMRPACRSFPNTSAAIPARISPFLPNVVAVLAMGTRRTFHITFAVPFATAHAATTLSGCSQDHGILRREFMPSFAMRLHLCLHDGDSTLIRGKSQ